MTPYWEAGDTALYCGEARAVLGQLPDGCAQACVTSPPFYFGRWYSDDPAEIGHEAAGDEYVAALVGVFHELRRVLQPDAGAWANLGDARAGAGYANHRNTGGKQRAEGGRRKHVPRDGRQPKSLLGLPWRFALAMQDDGWLLRSAVIWKKRGAQPNEAADRPAGVYGHVFLFTQQTRYRYYAHPLARTDVWEIPVCRNSSGHPAEMPPMLAEICMQTTTRPGDTVIDPFMGGATTLAVARSAGRKGIGIDLSEGYCRSAVARLGGA